MSTCHSSSTRCLARALGQASVITDLALHSPACPDPGCRGSGHLSHQEVWPGISSFLESWRPHVNYPHRGPIELWCLQYCPYSSPRAFASIYFFPPQLPLCQSLVLNPSLLGGAPRYCSDICGTQSSPFLVCSSEQTT